MFRIGRVRRFLMMPFRCRWNVWVRDCTAKLEGGWLIRSGGGFGECYEDEDWKEDVER